MTTNTETITIPADLFKKLLDGVEQGGTHACTVSRYAELLDKLTDGSGYYHEIGEYEQEAKRLWFLHGEARPYLEQLKK